jgi:hypothetical protein
MTTAAASVQPDFRQKLFDLLGDRDPLEVLAQTARRI